MRRSFGTARCSHRTSRFPTTSFLSSAKSLKLTNLLTAILYRLLVDRRSQLPPARRGYLSEAVGCPSQRSPLLGRAALRQRQVFFAWCGVETSRTKSG